jgi:hypothetical protein
LTPAAPGPDRVLARVADGCALAVIGIGLLAMAGWLFGIEPLTRVLPHLQSMKFNTALSFVLAGAALWWREQPAVRVGLGALVALIGALTLTEYLSGGDFGIDQLFVSAAAEGPTLPGRMSQSTAFCFFVSGAALGLMRSPRLAEALGLGAATVGGFALLRGCAHCRGVPVSRGGYPVRASARLDRATVALPGFRASALARLWRADNSISGH